MSTQLAPPEAWAPAHRVARRLTSPIRRFLAIEAASGLLLLAATAVALALANSPWSAGYADLWHTSLGVTVGDHGFARPLHWWVNDALMAVFFFVVGLEIRRELADGELAEWRRAALPLAAAVGGMLVPAAIYAALNHGRAGASGWGVPMATDIAFAVGVLTLLGRRAPPALRVLLLALAVIDDIGAILVIAIFYTDGVALGGLGVAAAGLAGVLGVRALGARSIVAYAAPGLAVWLGLYIAGIHPTLAGVIVGLATPVRAWFGVDGFVATARASLDRLAHPEPAGDLHEHLDAIARAQREAISPAERLIHRLHGVVAFGIMPLFALANAGVALGGASLAGDGFYVFVGIVLGLAVGKPLGIALACAAATGTQVATRPRDITGGGVFLVGMVGGIGFTMSLFVAQLAFPPGPLLETAKLAVLCGSAAAIVGGLLWGVLMMRPHRGDVATETEAERSHEA